MRSALLILALLLPAAQFGCTALQKTKHEAELAANRKQRRAEAAASMALHQQTAQYQTALEAWERGNVAVCEAQLRDLLAAGPEHNAARRALADLLVSQGRYSEAETELRTLLEREPNDSEHLHALGLLLEDSGRHAEAAVVLQQAAAAGSNNPLVALSAQAILGPPVPNGPVQPAPDHSPDAGRVLPASYVPR